MGGISIWQLLIVVVIVVLLFGTKKLSSLGSDLGASIKGFKKAMSDDERRPDEEAARRMACIMRPHNSSSVIGERVWVVSVFGSY